MKIFTRRTRKTHKTHKTHKKLLALFVVAILSFAGTAWAVSTILTLNGTYNTAIQLPDADANVFHELLGDGTVINSILGHPTALSPASQVLKINPPANGTITIAPAAGFELGQGLNSSGVETNKLQIIVNDSGDGGTVVMKASNGDAPALGTPTAPLYTRYIGGTLVYGGTLAITNDNSIGQGWAALFHGATLKAEGTTTIELGASTPAGRMTLQPLYLAHGSQNPHLSPDRGLRIMTVNVGKTGSVLQEMHLLQGVDEMTVTDAVASVGGGAGDTEADPTLLGANGDAIDHLIANSVVAARFVKTGEGKLFVTRYNTSGFEIKGMAHTGGTIVEAGTLKVDGTNATAYEDHFTGYVGSMWKDYTPAEDYLDLMDGGGRVPNYFAVTPDNAGNNNNRFDLKGGTAIVNRTQMFSDFNTAKGTSFAANEYTLAGTNYRPVINVMLMQRTSEANGKLSGSFDLVLNSIGNGGTNWREPSNNAYTNAAQVMLTVGNAENEIHGQTFIKNGVLAIGGGKSIGDGNLTVGTTDKEDVRGLRMTPWGDKAVFLGMADATFPNKTYVNGKAWSARPSYSSNVFIGHGALAADDGATVSFKDVTVTGAMEINPRAVLELISNQHQNGTIEWGDVDSYPMWKGTVVFGGEGNTYTLNGSHNLPTQIFVSRGTWRLNSYPADDGFAQVLLRQSGTLSLAKGVNDFSKRFDVQVDDDARIRVTPTAADVATSRAAASAKPALFSVRTIDTTWLGSGVSAKDRRLAVQLDLSDVGTLQKGQWIKVFEAEDAINWNNLHYLRDSSTSFYEDYAKVRPGLGDERDLSRQIIAHVAENPYVIYIEVLETVDPGTAADSHFTFDSTDTATATNAQISGSVTVKDKNAVVASEDVTFYLFHEGVDTSDNNNAIESVTVKTDANGVAAYLFNQGGYGNGAGYVIKAVSVKYGSATKSVTTSGSGTASSSSGGCDAGFGAFALLALAGGALVLRKKD